LIRRPAQDPDWRSRSNAIIVAICRLKNDQDAVQFADALHRPITFAQETEPKGEGSIEIYGDSSVNDGLPVTIRRPNNREQQTDQGCPYCPKQLRSLPRLLMPNRWIHVSHHSSRAPSDALHSSRLNRRQAGAQM
jgi:hypothetical protein